MRTRVFGAPRRSRAPRAAWAAPRTAALVVLLAAGCASPTEPSLDVALDLVAKDLAGQLGLFRGSETLVIDPLLDGASGQQTAASRSIQIRLATLLMSRVRGLEVLPFAPNAASKADLVGTGTLTGLVGADRYRLAVALSEQKSGLVVAQAAQLFRQPGLDLSPTPFYDESPSAVRDRSIDGYIRTTETGKGQPADALYLSQIPTAALLSQALDAYNDERWAEALERYEAAAQRPDGQQLRTFNGLYLSYTRVGRRRDAESAFGKIAALGLSTNNLAIKLLFRPGSTEYWPDERVSGAYPMWLRQVAQAARESDVCLNVVGHTSRSGTAAYNDRLSLSRARAVRAQLAAYAPSLRRRTKVTGVGFSENIVGTGTDDVSDAIDRRAEFRVLPCEEL